MNKLRVLLVDDHPVVRQGARLIIESEPDLEVCCEAATGTEAISAATSCRPDVVVLDLRMPDMDGLAAARQIKQDLPEVELVIFTAQWNAELIPDVFEAGAKSFIRKTDVGEALVTAIRAAGEHRTFLTPAVDEVLFAHTMNGTSGTHLTRREHEVIRLIAEGRSNKEVAALLGISARTAETHRATVMRKLGASSTAEVVRYAIRHGITEA